MVHLGFRGLKKPLAYLVAILSTDLCSSNVVVRGYIGAVIRIRMLISRAKVVWATPRNEESE